MARKGAVLGNFLLSDSQDIAGVETTIRQAASLWILGVQRELNELKRTLAMIPGGIRKPKPAEVTSLKLGQFIVCHGDQAIRTYVQPAEMDEEMAILIAKGTATLSDAVELQHQVAQANARFESVRDLPASPSNDALDLPGVGSADEYPNPQQEDEDMSKEDIEEMQHSITTLTKNVTSFMEAMVKRGNVAKQATSDATPATHAGNGSVDREELYNYIKSRLQNEAPKLLNVAASVPELQVTEEIKTINASSEGKSKLMGRMALLIADGFFDEPKSTEQVRQELTRYGLVAQKTYAHVTFSANMKNLVDWGFLFVEGDKYQANPRMKKHVKRA